MNHDTSNVEQLHASKSTAKNIEKISMNINDGYFRIFLIKKIHGIIICFNNQSKRK